ncbi:MAG: TonB-dependent receptor [Rhodospirillaceae bacterium]
MTDHRIRGARGSACLRTGTALLALSVAFPAVAADVVVEADRIARPSTTTVLPTVSTHAPAADAADLLGTLPGVTLGRMGGHGLEPTIRGQSQDRLSIISDGAMTFGGCPNRMDPPTASVPISTIDVVTVERGYQTVTNGPGGPGGTVRFERLDPEFAEEGARGTIGGGYTSNSAMRFGFTDLQAGSETGWLRLNSQWKRAGDYQDGNGDSVRAGFQQYGGDLQVGWRPSAGTTLSVSGGRDIVRDALFAGAGMDAPETIVDTFRARLNHAVQGGGMLTGVQAEVYRSAVDHTMDNYSLRVLTAAMRMRADTTSDTTGGRLAGTFETAAGTLEAGIDHRTNARDAVLLAGPAAIDPRAPVSQMWPGMTIAQTGLFAELEHPLSDRTTLTVGARADAVQSHASKADQPGRIGAGLGITARDLYRATYGTTDTSQEELNLGGLVRVTHGFDGWTGHAAVSRSVRTADASERGMARPVGAGWVGNPGLAPEKHHQAELGAAFGVAGWTVETAGWVDRVEDYILRDTARGQPGILVANGRTVYRNIDATLAGLEAGISGRIAKVWRVGADAGWTWGENSTDGTALSQIPPLSGRLEAAYEQATWSVGSTLRWATSQGRIDSLGGVDVRKTPGYGAVDLFATYDGLQPLAVRVGVTNLLNEAYSSHLSRSNGVDPQMIQVNEPGRAFYLQGRVNF